MNNDSFNKIVVLGSTGFIGSSLVKRLQNQYPGNKILGYSSADVNLLDKFEVMKLVQTFDVNTTVIMCAMLKKEFGDNIDSYSKNLDIAINLSSFLSKNLVKKFIYISSTAVYGEEKHNLDIRETTRLVPTSYYGMAKCASEQLFQKVFEGQEASSLLILRPPAIYGPEDQLHAYGPAGFIYKVLNNEEITLWGDGTELREFVYIDDLVEVIDRCVELNVDGVVNVVSGNSYTFKQVLDILEEEIDRPFEVENRERSKKKVDNVFKSDLIQELISGFEFTALKNGIKKTIEAEMSLLK